MSTFGQQLTFKQLLVHHQSVLVPIIQRDYAQGRDSEEEIRNDFLGALLEALILPVDNLSLPLNLDFIYGSVDGNTPTEFQPLDGQQRLTTLFLLHWYLAWQDSQLKELRELLSLNGKSRFSYAVRPSSSEFYDALLNYHPIERPTELLESVSRHLENQPWYFRFWRLDPTIQSSLKMLNAIHDRFHETNGLYDRLVNDEQPAITFQLLDLKNFGLSDDLYIKMNARGKPLTALETFKARYEQDLKREYKLKVKTLGDEEVSIAEYFSQRIDTIWADFFWNHRNVDTNLYDDVAINLFRVVILLSRHPESELYLVDVSRLRNKFTKSSYSTFQKFGWLDQHFAELLILLLDTWSEGENILPLLPDAQYFDEHVVLKKAMNEPTDLSSTEIVQFIGYVLYLSNHSESLDPVAFQAWMRIVFNLSINTVYDRPSDMQRSVAGFFDLVPYANDILGYFASNEQPTSSFREQQVAEEKLKAELLLADPEWKTIIDRAETHGYFKGQIEFLLDFCGALDKRRSTTSASNWKKIEHRLFQTQFKKHLVNAEVMFNSNGLNDLGEYRWQRALLSIGNYFLRSGTRNFSFLINPTTEQASWKRLLRGERDRVPKTRRVLQKLFDRIDATESKAIDAQLEDIIFEKSDIKSWQQTLIETPEAFAYCEKNAIRKNSDSEIYLLKKSQMNGAHVELFSYHLFHRVMRPSVTNGRFAPLELIEPYDSVVGTDAEPGFRLTWLKTNQSLTFIVQWKKNTFNIVVDKEELQMVPGVQQILRDEVGFSEFEKYLIKKASSNAIPNVLHQLAQTLQRITESHS